MPEASDLTFTPLTEAELAWFVEVRNSVREFLHDPRAFTVEDARAWFPQTPNRYFVIREGGQRVGYVRTLVHEAHPRVMRIGVDVAPAYQGRGLGTAVYPAFMRFVTDTEPIDCFRLEVRPENARARHVYEKLGFRVVGEDRSSPHSEVTSIHMELHWPGRLLSEPGAVGEPHRQS